MTFIDEIKQKWELFEKKPFPEMTHGRTVAGHNVTLLQSEIGAAIVSCITMNGVLGTRQRLGLEKALASLQEVIQALPDGAVREHFEELQSIGKRILGSSFAIA